MAIDTISTWHQYLESGDRALLNSLIDEDCVFYSPVVYSPQRGKHITMMYLLAAAQVLKTGFKYAKEIINDRHAVLEFESEIDGKYVNGIDMISWDESGRITEFKVMVRPLQAIHAIHAKMGEMLSQMKN